jgi:hypothetical protein
MSGSPKRETHLTEMGASFASRFARPSAPTLPLRATCERLGRHRTGSRSGRGTRPTGVTALRLLASERSGARGAPAWRCGRPESQPGAGRHHRGTSRADSGDDLLGIDSLEVDRGGAEVGVAELALVLLASRPMPKPERSGVCPIAAPTRTEPSTHPSRELMPSPGRPEPYAVLRVPALHRAPAVGVSMLSRPSSPRLR